MQQPTENLFEEAKTEEDEEPMVRGTKTLADVYARCNVVILEPRNYAEGTKLEVWRNAMQEEISMIEKNNTWILVDRPEKQKNNSGKVDLQAEGYVRSPNEHTLYVKEAKGDLIVISLYVDDLLITRSNPNQLSKFERSMQSKFEMTNLGEMTYFFGMEIVQSKNGIFVCQERYANEVLIKFRMENSKPADTPLVSNLKLSKIDGGRRVDEGLFRSLVGCLLYLTATQLDLMFAASYLSRFMSCPSELHYRVAKRVLRYVKGTFSLGIWFRRAENLVLVGYTDSHWGGSLDDMKSTSGYVFYINSGAISWLSKKQDIVAQSTAEA
ncbi:uncharacterized protein LOC116131724 [Pistacia vera]|uniref:uncharacterized protein LOC116131724 n=1 Tax=Pistacia vera TaxID=55513 RepID=UPI001262F60B|nr:uncharacterized protein LOC116131724 [Pistacia vera]